MVTRIKIGTLFWQTSFVQQTTTQLCRYSSYRTSPDISTFKPSIADYDESRSKDEWKYVKRILQPKIVPQIIPQDVYQSNWKPPTAKPGDHNYYISRNRNHMIPVYMSNTHRGTRKITEVCKIQGDIHAMEKDLKRVIETKSGKVVASQVNELVNVIRLKGDYVQIIKNYLLEKGF